jgi:site-specific DNA-methyltransferase (adenine-specific)
VINSIIHGDCEEIFPLIQKEYDISLVASDPPYNICFDGYEDEDEEGYQDNLTDEEYIELLSTFNGSPSAIIHYPEEMMKYVVPALGVPDEVLAWCYPSNIGRKFRLINIYGKKPQFGRVRQPYKNPKDKRIQERIRQGSKGSPLYDWFTDINIVKNVSKEKTSHPCPVPIALMERLILLLTDEGDLVVDPFSGSGTTALACIRLNRRYIGIERSKKYCKLANSRIEAEKEKTIDIFAEDKI